MADHDNIGRPTDHGPAAIRARFEVASQHVADLCSGKERWTLRIPAQPGRDSDLVISNSLEDIPRLLDRIAELADLLADVGRYLTATHAVLGQHDQLGIGLSCHGCGLEQKVAAAVESGQPAEAITTEDHRG